VAKVIYKSSGASGNYRTYTEGMKKSTPISTTKSKGNTGGKFKEGLISDGSVYVTSGGSLISTAGTYNRAQLKAQESQPAPNFSTVSGKSVYVPPPQRGIAEVLRPVTTIGYGQEQLRPTSPVNASFQNVTPNRSKYAYTLAEPISGVSVKNIIAESVARKRSNSFSESSTIPQSISVNLIENKTGYAGVGLFPTSAANERRNTEELISTKRGRFRRNAALKVDYYSEQFKVASSPYKELTSAVKGGAYFYGALLPSSVLQSAENTKPIEFITNFGAGSLFAGTEKLFSRGSESKNPFIRKASGLGGVTLKAGGLAAGSYFAYSFNKDVQNIESNTGTGRLLSYGDISGKYAVDIGTFGLGYVSTKKLVPSFAFETGSINPKSFKITKPTSNINYEVSGGNVNLPRDLSFKKKSPTTITYEEKFTGYKNLYGNPKVNTEIKIFNDKTIKKQTFDGGKIITTQDAGASFANKKVIYDSGKTKTYVTKPINTGVTPMFLDVTASKKSSIQITDSIIQQSASRYNRYGFNVNLNGKNYPAFIDTQSRVDTFSRVDNSKIGRRRDIYKGTTTNEGTKVKFLGSIYGGYNEVPGVIRIGSQRQVARNERYISMNVARELFTIGRPFESGKGEVQSFIRENKVLINEKGNLITFGKQTKKTSGGLINFESNKGGFEFVEKKPYIDRKMKPFPETTKKVISTQFNPRRFDDVGVITEQKGLLKQRSTISRATIKKSITKNEVNILNTFNAPKSITVPKTLYKTNSGFKSKSQFSFIQSPSTIYTPSYYIPQAQIEKTDQKIAEITEVTPGRINRIGDFNPFDDGGFTGGFTPPPDFFIPPSPFMLGFGGGGSSGGGAGKKKASKAKNLYSVSLIARTFNIKGTKQEGRIATLTGGIRPFLS